MQAESGSVLLANTNLGVGSWTETTVPVVVNPTGGYDSGETACPGYSSPILPSASGTSILYLAGTHLSNGKCEVRFGIDVAPGPTGTITGPGTTGKCVDVDTNTSTSGNAVHLWTCNGASGQQWSVESDGTLRAFGKDLGEQPVRVTGALQPATEIRQQRGIEGGVVQPETARGLPPQITARLLHRLEVRQPVQTLQDHCRGQDLRWQRRTPVRRGKHVREHHARKEDLAMLGQEPEHTPGMRSDRI